MINKGISFLLIQRDDPFNNIKNYVKLCSLDFLQFQKFIFDHNTVLICAFILYLFSSGINLGTGGVFR